MKNQLNQVLKPLVAREPERLLGEGFSNCEGGSRLVAPQIWVSLDRTKVYHIITDVCHISNTINFVMLSLIHY